MTIPINKEKKESFTAIQQNVSTTRADQCVWEQKSSKTRGQYDAGLQGQFEGEVVREEEDISTGTEGLSTDQSNSKNSSDMFVGPAVEGDFVKLQGNLYQQYGE